MLKNRVLITLILIGLVGIGGILYWGNNDNIFSRPLTASLAAQQQAAKPVPLEEFRIDIPPHINLTNFYKTYGERLLGNDDLTIIKREDWNADNNYADLDFIKSTCQKVYCSENSYDAEDFFSPSQYWNSRKLFLNYRDNFEAYDNFFLQKDRKENGVTYEYLPVENIIIHHTAGKFTTSFYESKKELQRIYFAHAVQRKWRDIGYHYLIDGAGRIFEGSLGGKYSVGSHTYMHNRGTAAIALMGDFRPGHDELTEPMKESLKKLVVYLSQQYGWNLNQKKFHLRKKDFSGREWTENIVKGHKEVDERKKITECPGVEPDELRTIIYPDLFND